MDDVIKAVKPMIADQNNGFFIALYFAVAAVLAATLNLKFCRLERRNDHKYCPAL